jgi:tRNA threonylcarbamoyladenosine biosynthesis protein TsaE
LLASGDVGAGKTTMSRGIIHRLVEEYDVRVTSPTYLLCNKYEGENGVQVDHFDLYRLSGRKDLSTLNIPAVFSSTISLIEWPNRLGEFKPAQHLAVDILIGNNDNRAVKLQFFGPNWKSRIENFNDLLDVSDLS